MADINNAKIYRRVSNTGTDQYAVVNLDATNFCITIGGSTKSLASAFVPADLSSDGKLKVYVKNSGGEQWTWDAYTTNQASSFVVRDSSGRVQASDPAATNDVVNLNYANNHYVPIVTTTGNMAAYVKWTSGAQGIMAMSWGSEGDTIALRDNQGRITIGAPTESGHAVNLGTLSSTLASYVPMTGIADGVNYDQWGNITVKGTSWSVHANTTSYAAGIQLDLSNNEKRVVINNARLITEFLTIDNNNTINSWYNGDWLTYTLPTIDGTLALTSQLTWGNITGKPSTFPPTAHSHSATDITSGTIALARLPVGTAATQVAAGNHTHNYLPLSGGTMTGPLQWPNSTALPQQTSPYYFVCIDAFADGGTTKWTTLDNIKSALGNMPPTAHSHSWSDITNTPAIPSITVSGETIIFA